MHELKLLSDDHALLSSTVIHVVALVRRVAAGRFEAANLPIETTRQAEQLHEQLARHFDFEETSAFPQLESLFPECREGFQRFVAEHDAILQALELLCTALAVREVPSDQGSLQRKALAFERIFESHATAETTLFNELAQRLRENAPFESNVSSSGAR